MKIRNATWVWSDTHFGHKNIVKFQQRPESHEAIMLSMWVERVREDDTILHLGDVLLGRQGNPKRWAAVLGRMPGRKYVIPGNHDGDMPLLESVGFTVIEPFIWEERGVAFTHRPITKRNPGYPEWDPLGARSVDMLQGWHTNVHGHIHGNEMNHHHDDGDPLPGRRYINVSVEKTAFAPVQIGTLV